MKFISCVLQGCPYKLTHKILQLIISLLIRNQNSIFWIYLAGQSRLQEAAR